MSETKAPEMTLSVSIAVPTCSIEAFALANQVTVDTVRGWIKNGVVPTKKLGKRVVINLALFTEQCKNEKGI